MLAVRCRVLLTVRPWNQYCGPLGYRGLSSAADKHMISGQKPEIQWHNPKGASEKAKKESIKPPTATTASEPEVPILSNKYRERNKTDSLVLYNLQSPWWVRGAAGFGLIQCGIWSDIAREMYRSLSFETGVLAPWQYRLVLPAALVGLSAGLLYALHYFLKHFVVMVTVAPGGKSFRLYTHTMTGALRDPLVYYFNDIQRVGPRDSNTKFLQLKRPDSKRYLLVDRNQGWNDKGEFCKLTAEYVRPGAKKQ